MTITPNMTDAEKIAALQDYIMSGTEMKALQEIVYLSSGNPCDPLHTIHAVAISAINKIRHNAVLSGAASEVKPRRDV